MKRKKGSPVANESLYNFQEDALTDEENMKSSLYLSQFDSMKFGDAGCLVNAVRK